MTSGVLSSAMKTRAALLLIPAALFALTACSTSGPVAVVASSPTTGALWPPSAEWTAVGSLAWRWTPNGGYDCKSYQDGCWGVTVTTQGGCPNGVYVEIAVMDKAGETVIDKANDITAGLAAGDTAVSVLSPPTGAPTGAKARLSKLNCL